MTRRAALTLEQAAILMLLDRVEALKRELAALKLAAPKSRPAVGARPVPSASRPDRPCGSRPRVDR